MIHAGDVAPGFELPTDGGAVIRSEELRGKRVVLFFYPKDDTPGCTKEACGFRDIHESFDEADAVVLGISPDGVASHEKFRDKFSLSFPLLADEGHKVADAYGVWGRKKLYGREYEGILRTTFVIGSDGVVEKVYEQVRPEGHPEAVLAALGTGE